MAVGVDPPAASGVAGVAMEFPASEESTTAPLKMPRRLRSRLLVSKTSPSTVEEIESKLRDADLRRQKFYANLSSKARLKPRSTLQSSLHEEDFGQSLEAKLQASEQKRCWRQFLRLNKTTLQLAKAYDALSINAGDVKSMPFEQLALLIESPTTLHTVQALLDRLEIRCGLSKPATDTANPSTWDDIDHLLKRVASPNRRVIPRKSIQTKDAKRRGSVGEAAKSTMKSSRYQGRVLLCAYMILGHPDAVFTCQGEHEIALTKTAENFIKEFELLIKIVLSGPTLSSSEESGHALARDWTFSSQLATFDSAWCLYLNSFVAWKVKDAESLEEDLVGAACQLELSMIQTCKITPDGDRDVLTHVMKAVKKQVTEDQKLVREKVHHLSGDAGIERLERALSDTRTKYYQGRDKGSPVGAPIKPILAPSLPSLLVSSSISIPDESAKMIEDNQRPNPAVHSMFRDDSPPKEVGSFASSSGLGTHSQNSDEKLAVENELIVNEVLHEQHHTFAGGLNVTDDDQSRMKSKIKETMEKAFWDGLTDTIKQDEPNYGRVVQLMREVRDEICGMAPQSWKEEIFVAIDPDILSQLLNSGELDMGYLGKVLEFALITLQKLSAPANENELKIAHQKLLIELAEICQAGDGSNRSRVIALIKGLRFVLEQILTLKKEISWARIKIMEPLLRGPAGLDYLKNAFDNHYGPPSDALTSLPLTMRWLSSVWDSRDQEWLEHTNALSELTRSHESSFHRLLPYATLRTGGSILVGTSDTSKEATDVAGSDSKHPECKGEKVDLLVRLGLLKLVSGVSGLTQEAMPETLKLNLVRLRAVQAQLQKIIVICTSILVLRQTLLSDQIVRNPADMEVIVLSCVKQLSDLVDSVQDAGIKEIHEILGTFAEGDTSGDTAKLQSRKDMMLRLLTKSLQADDLVFVRVSRAVYLAARAIVLGGSGSGGRELAEMALRQVGAAVLLDQVEEAATVLLVASTVTCGVHGPWYGHLIEKM